MNHAARLTLEWLSFAIVFGTLSLRFYALRRQYFFESPGRVITNICLLLVALLALPSYICNTYAVTQKLYFERLSDSDLERLNIQLVPPFMLPKAHAESFLIYLAWSRFNYVIILWLVKFSFIGIFLECKQSISRALRIFLWVTTGVIVITLLFNLILLGVWCRPFDTVWRLVPGQKLCSPFQASGPLILAAITNIGSDVIVVILGYTIISSLRLDRKRFRKVEILAIFTLGGITILFSVLRTTFLLLAIETGSSIANMDRKLSLDAYGALFSHWEDVAAVIAGCLPGLRVLWRGNHRRTVTTTAVTPSGKAPTVSGQWFRIPKPEQAAVLHSHQQDDSSLSLKEVQITNGKTAEFSHVELQALDLPLERKRGII